MKNQMATKKSIGKISSFLRGLRSGIKKHSENRGVARHPQYFPASTKVGAGVVTARRSLPALILHKRNHRENTIICN
jgi:hypothetical protein